MRIWLDRSASLRKFSDLDHLSRLAGKKGIVIVVSAQVYLEDRRQTRLQKGPSFSAKKFDAIYEQLVHVVSTPFDRETAARWADRLAQRYPTDEAWREAKRATLGGVLRAAFEVEPARVPMTTDWWVALAAEDEPTAVAMAEDRGEEWRVLRKSRRAFTWDEARTWLQALPDAPG